MDFCLTAASLYSLPMLTEQDSFVCYRTSVSSHDESRCALEDIWGALSAGAVTVTKGQCYELLRAQWPAVSSWFADIFTPFSPPSEASDAQKLQIKTTLQLWILQFGPSELKKVATWQTLVGAFKTPGANWSNYLAWAVSPRGYTLDGVNTLQLPNELEDQDLAVLNVVSTLCDSPSCGFEVQCGSISSSLACAPP